MDISAKLENQLNQFEQLRGQLQMIMNQKVQMGATLKEVQGALEELQKVKEGTPTYKNVGSLLIKVVDVPKLVEELKEQEDSLGIRIKQLEKQEKVLNEKYVKLQETIQQEIQTQGK